MSFHRFIIFSIGLAFAAWVAPAWAEKRVAFVVGVDKYDKLEPRSQLKKAGSDAEAVAATFKSLGFEVLLKRDLARSDLNQHWQDFLNMLAPGDVAAFFFAGHGVELGGENYLLPRDVPAMRPGREEHMKRESLSVREFLKDLEERQTRLNVVILDACRDNPFEAAAGRSLGGGRGLATIEPPHGTFIMFSAAAKESALDRLSDGDSDPNSVYTRRLLPLLKTPGLTLAEIAKQTRMDVNALAKTVGHRQTPAYYDQINGDFCPAGGACGRTSSTAPVQPQSPAAETAAEAERRRSDEERAAREAARERDLAARRAEEKAARERLEAELSEREAKVAREALREREAAVRRAEEKLAQERREAELAQAREDSLARAAAQQRRELALRRAEEEAARERAVQERLAAERRAAEQRLANLPQSNRGFTPERSVAPADRSNVSYHYVGDARPPDDFLALRTEPSTRSGRRIREMPNGTLLEVLQKRPDGWWRVRVVDTGDVGWALHGQGSRLWVHCCASR